MSFCIPVWVGVGVPQRGGKESGFLFRNCNGGKLRHHKVPFSVFVHLSSQTHLYVSHRALPESKIIVQTFAGGESSRESKDEAEAVLSELLLLVWKRKVC